MSSLYEQYRDTLRQGHVAALGGRHRQALAAYREAASLIGQRAAPLIGIGRVQLALGRRKAALAAFDAALALDPGNEEALAGRARAEAWSEAVPPRALSPQPAHGSRVPDDAPELRDLAGRWEVARNGADADGLLEVAVGLARLDRPRAAGAAMRDALTAAPGDPRTYRVAAWIERRSGGSQGAAATDALLERYLALVDDTDDLERRMMEAEDRHDIVALLEIAEAHRRQGRPRSALEACGTALGLAPADARVHLAIARSHLAMGMRGRVVRELVQLARLLEMIGDEDGRARVVRFVNADLMHRQPSLDPI